MLFKENKLNNILSLFDGLSCGQLAINHLGIEYNNYYASEVDKYAMAVTNYRYPNTIHLGDIKNIIPKELPEIDLLIGGSPCFVAGTKVICKNKIKNIEDIEIGDEVLTHKNRYRKVLAIGGDGIKEIHSLKAHGIEDIKCTDNHPFFVREFNKDSSFSEPKKVQLKDLKENIHYLKLANPNNTLEIPLNLTKNDYTIIDDEIWLPIRQIKPLDYSEKIYNIEVEEDHTYTANNVVTFNCQSFSFAGKRNGMTTKEALEILSLEHYLELKEQNFEFEGQSYLFWEYMRILKATKPKFFLLENVKMTQKWQKVLTDAIGVEPILINSALVTAQNRQRLYWVGERQEDGKYKVVPIEQPKDKGIILRDILDYSIEDFYPKDKEITKIDNHTSNVGIKCVAGFKGTKKWLEDGKNLQRNFSQGERIYSEDGKSITLSSNSGGTAGKGSMIVEIKGNWKPIFKKNYCQWDLNGKGNDSQDQRAYYMDGKHGTIPSSSTSSKCKVLIDDIPKDIKTGECKLKEYNENSICHHIADATDIKGFESVKRVYSETGKSPTLTCNGGGNREVKVLIDDTIPSLENWLGTKEEYYELYPKILCGASRGRYVEGDKGETEQMLEIRQDEKTNCITTVQKDNYVTYGLDKGDRVPLKDIKNESCTKNNKAYCLTARYDGAVAWNSCQRKQRTMIPIEETDEISPNVYNGVRYRKLTPLETERLQTMPDDYSLVPYGDRMMSNSQRFKMIGNSFSRDVISHIISFMFEKKKPKSLIEEIDLDEF